MSEINIKFSQRFTCSSDTKDNCNLGIVKYFRLFIFCSLVSCGVGVAQAPVANVQPLPVLRPVVAEGEGEVLLEVGSGPGDQVVN